MSKLRTDRTRMYVLLSAWLLAAGTAFTAGSPASAVDAARTERLSESSEAAEADQQSDRVSISANGRYVAFDSKATNLVPNDTNGHWDVFVRDRRTGIVRRVSISSSGVQGNSESRGSVISADGHVVAFQSGAINLTPKGVAGGVYVHNLVTGNTQSVSIDSRGVPARGGMTSISADGRHVAFTSTERLVPSDTNRWEYSDIYVRDRRRRTTQRVSVSTNGRQANGYSGHPVISADGRYVAFESYASTLVRGDTGTWDVFVRDRLRRTTEKVSVNFRGALAAGASREPSISPNGRFVAFTSGAEDLVRGDSNDEIDVFVRDRTTGMTERVSVNNREGEAKRWSRNPVVSADGRYVAFTSLAPNLVRTKTNHLDVYVRDRASGTTRRVSVNSDGRPGNGNSEYPVISADGRYVAFPSMATNMVPDDTNGRNDVFLRDLGPS